MSRCSIQQWSTTIISRFFSEIVCCLNTYTVIVETFILLVAHFTKIFEELIWNAESKFSMTFKTLSFYTAIINQILDLLILDQNLDLYTQGTYCFRKKFLHIYIKASQIFNFIRQELFENWCHLKASLFGA